MQTIPTEKNLEPYVKLASKAAQESPCLRRKYGAVVVYRGPDIDHIAATNERLSRCCYGQHCARTTRSITNGSRPEVGAEVHAETAALIRAGRRRKGDYFILVGFLASGKELYGPDVFPCHVCALNIKFAGYKYIYLKPDKGYPVSPVSIDRIIEWREEEWML